MLKYCIFFLAALALVAASCNDDTPVEEVQRPLQWVGGSFLWPCPSTEKIYKSSGRAITKNVIGTRAQIYGDQVYIAMPRYR